MATLQQRLAALPEVVSVDDLADVFAVDRQTIWRWLRQGHLPGHRIGRIWRIWRDDLIKAFDGSESPSSPAERPVMAPGRPPHSPSSAARRAASATAPVTRPVPVFGQRRP